MAVPNYFDIRSFTSLSDGVSYAHSGTYYRPGPPEASYTCYFSSFTKFSRLCQVFSDSNSHSGTVRNLLFYLHLTDSRTDRVTVTEHGRNHRPEYAGALFRDRRSLAHFRTSGHRRTPCLPNWA